MSRPVSRILSARAIPGGGNHPSGSAVAGRLKQLPANSGEQPSSVRSRRTAVQPRCLAPGGVYLAGPVTWSAGALLPHPFTLTAPAQGAAVCSLLHLPSGRPGLPLATTVLDGVRTFLDVCA